MVKETTRVLVAAALAATVAAIHVVHAWREDHSLRNDLLHHAYLLGWPPALDERLGRHPHTTGRHHLEAFGVLLAKPLILA